jgi:hypothetical protein
MCVSLYLIYIPIGCGSSLDFFVAFSSSTIPFQNCFPDIVHFQRENHDEYSDCYVAYGLHISIPVRGRNIHWDGSHTRHPIRLSFPIQSEPAISSRSTRDGLEAETTQLASRGNGQCARFSRA